MQAINPATEEILRNYEETTDRQIDLRLQTSERAFLDWRKESLVSRADKMRSAAKVLRERAAAYGLIITHEMGKPIEESKFEIEKCAWGCEFYATHAERFLAPQTIKTDASQSYVRYDPLGPVLAIMPWNFPFWQLFRFAAPALMAGNVAVLKHASNVPGCALAIEDVFRRAGFAEGVMTTLLVGASKIERVLAHPAIRAVTLTGSEKAGREVAALAGRLLKKSVLELGGSDPFIVLADVDIKEVAARAAKGRTINSGQSCIAAKRFIVEESVAAEFQRAFVLEMKRLSVGDPLDPKTQIGPLARRDLCDDLDDQVRRSVQAGARLLLGGKRLDRRGYFYAPTVLTDVKPGMAAFDEETFGPVAAIVRAENAEHALELANRSAYGLGASLHTRDEDLAHRLAAQLDAGCVFINGIVKSDPRLPFGGVKNSGYGRELSDVGIREFTNVKTVWCA